MAYSEPLAALIRGALASADFTEKKMFGGLCFMVQGHMCCGVAKDELMVRVGPDAYDKALARKHARHMDFTGRPLKGMIYVGTEGCKTARQVKSWTDAGLVFVQSLPAK